MNRKQKKKLAGVVCFVAVIAVAAGLVLYALKQNINLFFTPTQLLQANMKPEQVVRLGGYVSKHTVHYSEDGKTVVFTVTDMKNTITVSYQGVLPSLFREGQGVVVTGSLVNSHLLAASQVLAKHDEKYVPWALRGELKKM